jgi:hypothetical protein
MSQLWKLGFAVAMVAAMGSRTEAGFDPSLASMSSTSTTTTFTYTLAYTSATNSGGTAQLNSGSFLTLYDLYTSPATLASFSTPTGISLTQQLIGSTPSFGPQPIDSSSLENLTFTYTGATLTTNTNFSVTFTLNGLFTTRQNNYTSLTQFTADGGGVGQIATISSVSTPTPVAAAVPEPSSLALCGIAGVFGLGVARLRRGRSA